ncbi:hypothetical protein BBD31_01680 [Elizabethkingia anophelis]|nr:hypothetical protein BBD31_01680 [Elizabethkingia anophelis]MDV3673680.1 hypothetical protein [Elizabethkingia anophelis]MDV3692404.1 hypothetical protein [Elizabethkingia anophelis]OPB50065.1 hypothetical protein BAY04_06820 [Elizabethkingia anophelis]SPW16834.1 Uncharacterised protein [Elizabethkingia anophelis]
MNIRYRNYRRRKFENWRSRVKAHIPELVKKFYSYTGYIPYEYHVKLGRVITNINNPFYSFQDDRMNNVDEINEVANEICLEILVEEVFKFINKLP